MAFAFGGGVGAAAVPPLGSTAGMNDLAIPDLFTIFPHLQLAEAIQNGGEILPIHPAQILAALVDAPASAAPNESLRSQLLNMNLIIQNARAARLQNYMLPDIIFISNSLQVSEATAIGLYHHAASNSAVDSYRSSSPTTVKDAAIRLYWDCRRRQVQLAKHALIRGLQDANIGPLLLNDDSLLQQVARGLEHRKIKHPDQYMYTKEIHAERNVLAEICYFAAYQQPQWSALIYNIALQQQVEVLDAFHHVPSPASHTIPSWEQALVDGAFSTGLPQSLLTYAMLMAAVSCNHASRLDIAELRHSIIPALSTFPACLEENLVTRDFLLTSVGQYLAASKHQHPDWYASANLLCGMGFSWVFERHGPAVASDSDDPHALVFAYHTGQILSPEGSNRILRRYKSQLDGSSSTSSSSTFNGNTYYTNYNSTDASFDPAASTIVQRTLGDSARSMVMAHALHSNDWKLLLEFALGTPIDRHVRGVLLEAASRIIAESSRTMDDAALLVDNALRLLAEFHAVPPQRGLTTMQQFQQQHFMFFLPSDVTKASHDGGVRFDATFGMLFSVLIAEKETGYEATVGFLRLLTTIAQWTVVPALYAEYAVFVLDHVQAKTDRDRDRVYAAALEFLQSVLVRYDCASENKTFGYDELNLRLVVEPPKVISAVAHSDFQDKSQREAVVPGANVGQGPSAGFFVLVSMLCRNRCSLLKRIIDVLMRWPNADKIASCDKLTLTRALYRDTPPSLSTARIGASRQVTKEDRKTVCEREKHDLVFSSGEDFGTQAMQSALTILCATLIRETEFRRKAQDSNRILRYVPTLNVGKQVNDVTLHISGNLVHLFAEGSPWGALIEKIGLQTTDPIVEATVSSMATAALWGLLDKLPVPQISLVLHTQGDSGPGGTNLAKAVTRRLQSYSLRSLQSEDLSYLHFLMKSILSDLRNPLKVISSSLFGSTSRVMEALMHLLESDDFLFGAESVDVAVQCLETIYLLTWIGGDIGDVVVSAKRASCLREKDFWNVNLKRLFHQGVDITVHLVHGIAWLLQGFANELYLVGGAASGAIDLPSDQQLLAPQPPLIRRYVSDLMLEDDAYVLEALKILPFEAANSPTHPSSLNTEEAQMALRASKVESSSPGGISGGFMVNTSLLAKELGRDFKDWDQVELWVGSYNTSVAVECAATHLSDALSLVVGSAVVMYFPSTGNDLTVAGSKHILLALLDPLSRQEHLRSGTARCFAKMVFVIAGTLSETKLDDEFATFALRLLFRAITNTSGQASSFYANDSYKHGTVAILASSFLLLLRGSIDPAYLLDEGDLTDFCRAFSSSVASGLSTSEASSAIRRFICACIEFSRSRNDNYLGQFFRSVLSDPSVATPIESNAAALARLIPEEDALLVIGQFCTIPGIAGFMIGQGAVTALQNIAQNYNAEETKMLVEQQQSLSLIPAPEIPANLSAILRCLCLFMSSPNLDKTCRIELFVNAIGILKCFRNVFYHAADNFPKPGTATLLLEFTRCMFEVQILKRSLSNDTQPFLTCQSVGYDDILSYSKVVARLSLQISRNLLPRAQNRTNQNRVWWDDIDTGSISKHICKTAVQAAELASLGLSLLVELGKEDRIEIGKLDETEMCQVIRRCFETLMDIKRQMGLYVGAHGSDSGSVDIEDVDVLFRKGHGVLTMLLLTALVRIESIKKSMNSQLGSVFSETFQSMEQLRGIELLDGSVNQDENRRGTLSQLVDAVKKECGSSDLLIKI